LAKTAIILGASGLTGGLLLEKLLADERYSKVLLFSRKPSKRDSPKIKEFVIDLFELDHHAMDFVADEVFCCIGTTKKKTPDQEEYRKIDFGIPVQAAKLCAKNNIETFIVMSSMGANEKSSIFYSRLKGEMENEVLNQHIDHTYLLRPSLIVGNRNEFRSGEGLSKGIFKLMNPLLIGKLKKYRSIQAERIAEAMIQLANTKPQINVVLSDQIQALAGS
jgi:uncharacterized protein YbjT (DUF2867 family)